MSYWKKALPIGLSILFVINLFIVETDEGLLAAWFGGMYERHLDICISTSVNKNGRWSSSEKNVVRYSPFYQAWVFAQLSKWILLQVQ